MGFQSTILRFHVSFSGGTGEKATFSRPGPLSVFFLAQRPYLFQGTLREQVGNWLIGSGKVFSWREVWMVFGRLNGLRGNTYYINITYNGVLTIKTLWFPVKTSYKKVLKNQILGGGRRKHPLHHSSPRNPQSINFGADIVFFQDLMMICIITIHYQYYVSNVYLHSTL
jgi:hypothetical protein